jgi:hypothetical protein
VHLFQQRHHADGLQEVKEVIQYRPFVEPVHPIDHLLAVQAPRPAVIIALGDLPTQPLRQVLRNFVWCVPHGPPSSVVCVPAREESGCKIKVLAYVGTSETRSLESAFQQSIPCGAGHALEIQLVANQYASETRVRMLRAISRSLPLALQRDRTGMTCTVSPHCQARVRLADSRYTMISLLFNDIN